MKFPLSWLKEYIDLNLSSAQIAKILSMAGIEVDALEKVNLKFSKVVVGQIIDVQPHPNADKLTIASVTDGNEVYQVVCGAPNCRKGMKSALALVGATLTDEKGESLKIKKTKLRGTESHGMLCSGIELGISHDGDGILEFAEHIKLGADLSDLYADTIFHVSLTPNLGHCASLVGIARELAASTGVPVKLPSAKIQEAAIPINESVKVEVEDPKDCPRYTCRLIRNVKAGASPSWLQDRLTACGFRPVNVIVDITNFVLLELGQPLHAFDFQRVEGGKIIVRRGREGEKLATLDGKERELTAEMLLICDQSKPLAVAGVMGGGSSEVAENTVDVLLESAFFRAGMIRKTGKALGLQTEASRRFEKEVDPNGLIQALDRAAGLISQFAGGEIAQGVIDVAAEEFLPRKIDCRLSKINGLLGLQLSVSEVEAIFHRLDFRFTWNGQDTFAVHVPTYRRDLFQEVDLIEEIARIFGYENIGKQPVKYQASPMPHAPLFLFEREVRSRLIDEGLQEFITCDLVGPTLLNIVQDRAFPSETHVRVLNPTSIEQSELRTSLLPGLLELAKYNYDHQNHDVSGFEIGRIHFKSGQSYKEQSVIGIILMGKSRPYHWDPKPQDADFFDLKGMVENLLKGIGIERFTFHHAKKGTLHSGRQTSVSVEGLEIGSFGEVHPAILRRLDLPRRVLFAEFNLQDLYQKKKPFLMQKPIPIYPSSERDWTVTLSEETPMQRLLLAVRTAHSRLLEDVSLLDVYKSEQIGALHKNVTLHFVYRDSEKTVSQEEVDAEHERITNHTLMQLKSTLE